MKTIHKYVLPIKDEVVLEVPGGGQQVLLVAEQHGSLTMWMQVNDELPLRKRTFRIRGTGPPWTMLEATSTWAAPSLASMCGMCTQKTSDPWNRTNWNC